MSEYEKLLAWVRVRSEDDGAGCLIWQSNMAHGKEPNGSYMGKVILVRRELWKAKTGKPLPSNVSIRCKCEQHGCVELEHLIKTSRQPKLGPHTVSHRKNIALALRKAVGKLDDEAVADIRGKQESRGVYAERYGINITYVNQIQAHGSRKEYGNPFLGLMR